MKAGFGIVGAQGDRAVVAGERILQAALPFEHNAQVNMRLGERRLEGRGLAYAEYTR